MEVKVVAGVCDCGGASGLHAQTRLRGSLEGQEP